MWRYSATLLALLVPIVSTGNAAPDASSQAAPSAIVGRWDLTVKMPDGDRPSWLEVRPSGRATLVGRFVGEVGSARPIARIEVSDGVMRFAIPPQWEQGEGDLTVEGRLTGDELAGTMTRPDGQHYSWTAKRAPKLLREREPVWGDPINLLNGTDLTGWRAIGANEWRMSGGILQNTKAGGNLVTERRFQDFKLHLEFRYPEKSNSGVYLRGRYEAQIEDPAITAPSSEIHGIGAIYGFLPPNALAAKKPGEWQSYDITLVGRIVTVVLNGKLVVCEGEIPGITGGALDSDEGAPGPLFLQGDHGPVEYRNITIRPAR